MSVTTKHRQYIQYEDSWAALRNAYAGAGAIKAAPDMRREVRGVKLAGTRYLPRPPGMVLDSQYAIYRDRATFLAATKHCVHGITGAIFRKEPVVEAPTALEPQLEDITQTGVPLRTFAEEAVRETLLMGRFGVLVDFPQTTVTEDGFIAPAAASRPYWVAYQAEEILNWRTFQRQGDTVLSLVVLQECVPVPQGPWPSDDFFVVQDQLQYRVLRLNPAGQYEVSLWIEIPQPDGSHPPRLMTTWIPLRNGEPLDFIPFIFMAPFSLEPAVEDSLLEGLVEVNYRYYRHSADYEQALFLLGSPTPYVCSDSAKPSDELLLGPSYAWWIQGAASKVGMLGLDPGGLPAHQIAMDTDKKDMALFGSHLLEAAPRVQETATANLMRLAGADSPMQSLITTVSQGLTQALQIQAWWGGFTEDVDDTAITISLNKDIVASDMPPQMLLALMQALLNGTISQQTFFYNLQQGELTMPGMSFEDEQALIELQQEQQPLAPAPQAVPGQPPPPARNGATRAAA